MLPLEIPDLSQDDALNAAALTELMGDLNKKGVFPTTENFLALVIVAPNLFSLILALLIQN